MEMSSITEKELVIALTKKRSEKVLNFCIVYCQSSQVSVQQLAGMDQSMVSMSISQAEASNCTGTRGAGVVTIFLSADDGGVVRLRPASVLHGMSSGSDEADAEEMLVGTNAGLTEGAGGKVALAAEGLRR